MFSPITVVYPLAVDGTMTVFNFGPGGMSLQIGALTFFINAGNSAVFSIPKGTAVQYGVGVAAGNWQLAVPD